MKLIDRFISRELLVNVTFAIAVLSLVLVVGNIFRKLLPLLVNHDVPMEYLIRFIAYVLPFSLIFTIPWGLLTAILLVFGRLSADNELIALRANGVSVTRVSVPLAGIAIGCTAICLWLNVQVAPAAQERLRSTIFDLATRNPMALFGSDQVIDQFPGRRIYVGKKEGNKLENITVFEMNEKALPVKVTYARTGMLEADLANKRILMHLYDARYQERDSKDPFDLQRSTTASTWWKARCLSVSKSFTRKRKNDRAVPLCRSSNCWINLRAKTNGNAARAGPKSTNDFRFRSRAWLLRSLACRWV